MPLMPLMRNVTSFRRERGDLYHNRRDVIRAAKRVGAGDEVLYALLGWILSDDGAYFLILHDTTEAVRAENERVVRLDWLDKEVSFGVGGVGTAERAVDHVAPGMRTSLGGGKLAALYQLRDQ